MTIGQGGGSRMYRKSFGRSSAPPFVGPENSVEEKSALGRCVESFDCKFGKQTTRLQRGLFPLIKKVFFSACSLLEAGPCLAAIWPWARTETAGTMSGRRTTGAEPAGPAGAAGPRGMRDMTQATGRGSGTATVHLAGKDRAAGITSAQARNPAAGPRALMVRPGRQRGAKDKDVLKKHFLQRKRRWSSRRSRERCQYISP